MSKFMSKPSIHVAIALLFHYGKVLVGWRNADQHQGNKYEFPGGKVESGETPEQACCREVFEEVGVGIDHWHQFDVIHHDYEDIEVFLHIFHTHITEEYLADIQKPWTWYRREQLLELNFPKANQAMIQRLYWSHQIKISDQLAHYQPENKDQLFYWRINAHCSEMEQDIEQLKRTNIDDLSQIILNVDVWKMLPVDMQKHVSAVHFKHNQLMDLVLGQLPIGIRCIAACHDLVSLQHAQLLGFDAVTLSPVLKTQTHPNSIELGWEKFAEYAKTVDIPIFSLGGLSLHDLKIAQQYGAYGVAGIRQF